GRTVAQHTELRAGDHHSTRAGLTNEQHAPSLERHDDVPAGRVGALELEELAQAHDGLSGRLHRVDAAARASAGAAARARRLREQHEGPIVLVLPVVGLLAGALGGSIERLFDGAHDSDAGRGLPDGDQLGGAELAAPRPSDALLAGEGRELVAHDGAAARRREEHAHLARLLGAEASSAALHVLAALALCFSQYLRASQAAPRLPAVMPPAMSSGFGSKPALGSLVIRSCSPSAIFVASGLGAICLPVSNSARCRASSSSRAAWMPASGTTF